MTSRAGEYPTARCATELFYKGKNVAVVGGGDSALQSALFLASYCKSVTLIHRRGEFRGEKALVKKLGEKDNIKVLMNTKVVKLIGSDELDGIKIATGDEEPHSIPMDGVFFCGRSDAEQRELQGCCRPR